MLKISFDQNIRKPETEYCFKKGKHVPIIKLQRKLATYSAERVGCVRTFRSTKRRRKKNDFM